MIQGLTGLVRVVEREPGGVTGRNELSSFGGHFLKGLNLATETFGTEANLSSENESDAFAADINFQLIPSCTIHMNREAREHIVDFFR